MNESSSSLQSVYQDPTFSEFGKPFDAKLRTDDGTEFEVYSVLLSRQSEFFDTLFSIADDGEESITIQGIDSRVFETVLVYLYTSCLNITRENMMELLVASNFLVIESLRNVCRSFILHNNRRREDVEDCLKIFLTARRIQEFEIECKYRRFFVICFEKALQHSMDIASDFPFSVLKDFLGNRSLNITGERVVWSLIESWVEKDPSNRMQNVPELLRFLSIDEIEDDVASDMISSPIILKNQLYEDIGDPRVTLAYLSDKHKAQTIIAYRNEEPVVTGVRQPQSVHFVTKVSDRVEMFITYDNHIDLRRKVGELPLFWRMKLLRVEHRIYIVEEYCVEQGFKGYFYDLLREEIKPMATIPYFSAGPYFRKIVVEVAGRIYVFGDFSRMVRYVEETDEWTDIGYGSGVSKAVSLNDRIYILGFFRRDMPLNLRMKLYDPFSETCVEVSSPGVGLICSIPVVYHERIFLIGGYYIDERRSSRTVEVYDPVQGEWEPYPELLYEYYDISATVWKGRLYVYDYRDLFTPVTFWDGSGGWNKLEDRSLEIFVRNFRFCSIEGEDLVKEVMKKNKETDVFDWKEFGM